MKTIKILISTILILTSFTVFSQVKKDSTKSNNDFNIVDAQLGALKTMIGDEKIDGIDFKSINNYNDLLKQTKGLSTKEKAHYKALYQLQAKAPNQKTKDSIGKIITESILKSKTN